MFKYIIEIVRNFAIEAGLSESAASFSGNIVAVIVLLLLSWVAYYITWKVITIAILPVVKKSKTTFDDLLENHNFFKRVAYFTPALLLYYLLANALGTSKTPNFLLLLINIWMVIITILIVTSILSTIRDYYQRYEISKERPIDSLIQVLKIITYVIGILVIISLLVKKDIGALLISLGTMSAVLMLIFRDPILGFVGGLQLTFNKMVRIGDWISMPRFNADGVVKEITLTVVKVQNWDKTISMIPTYAMVSNSFQNWKGMEESGGRRIKRSVNIDMDSIKFCDNKML
jgi:miniconductance mechanosensitive channel